MSKISLPVVASEASVEVTRSQIETLINQIEFLIEGRVDIDNIAQSDTGDYAEISAETVQDIASPVRPMAGRKLVGIESGLSDPEYNFLRATQLMESNKNFIVLSKKEVKEFINEDTKTFPSNFDVVIEKSPNIVASLNKTDEQTLLNGYYVTADGWITCNDTDSVWWWEVTDLKELPESITITFTINDHYADTFEDSNYMTISVIPKVLCEVMP